MSYELAQLIPSVEVLNRVEEGVMKAFEGRSGAVRGYDIIGEVCNYIPSHLQRALLTTLKSAGVLSTIKASSHVENHLFNLDESKLMEFMGRQRLAAEVLSEVVEKGQQEGSRVRIVATMPKDWERIEGIDPTDESIRRIIIRSKQNLWIVSPFFDDFGKVAIEESLIGRARLGIKIRVIGRQLSQIDVRRNMGSIDALQTLTTKFAEMGLAGYIEIREFTTRNHSTQETQSNLHSKIVIADGEVCYLGSANMTEWSLSRNFELGVELMGDELVPICKMVTKLWEESTPFSYLKQSNLD